MEYGGMKYDGMDKECIPLCDAMNALPGIQTYCSCYGHNRTVMRISFSMKNEAEKSFRKIISRFPKWEISEPLCISCASKGGKQYKLRSGSVGEKAYKESIKIAQRTRDFLEKIDNEARK